MQAKVLKALLRGVTMIACGLSAVWAHAQTLQPGEAFRDCDTCPEMVVVPTGSFDIRNAPWGPGHPHNEGFFYPVTFTQQFAIGKFEITFDEWAACVADGKCEPADDAKWGRGRRPVINTSWIQAIAYTRWLSVKAGQHYRLPTNAEWEYSARAGLGMNRFFGIAPTEICKYANVYDETSHREFEFDWEHVPCDDGQVVTASVGSFQPNAFGLHDMIGNVFEWTEDCASPNWRGAPQDGNAWLKGDCSLRGYRGASWLTNEPYYLREGDRFQFSGARADDLGIRVVRELR
jgi:formylglycine-generating enzyme required for sulfatase activity